MRASMKTVIIVGATTIAIGASAYELAFAQGSPLMRADPQTTTLTLGNNEGVYVSTGNFKVDLGKAKGDPSAKITEMGAKEVSHGAIIFRSGDKLYIVDGKPAESTPQAMKSFSEDVWGQSRLMKSFDDAWQRSPLMR
jgi:hypothetical protein